MTGDTKYQDALDSVRRGLADSVLDMSDDEIRAEIDTTGDNSTAMKQILLNAVQMERQRVMRDARQRHEENVKNYGALPRDIPGTPQEKRSLLYKLIDGLNVQGQLTLQNRDFSDVPDEDLDGYLRQIFELKDADSEGGEE